MSPLFYRPLLYRPVKLSNLRSSVAMESVCHKIGEAVKSMNHAAGAEVAPGVDLGFQKLGHRTPLILHWIRNWASGSDYSTLVGRRGKLKEEQMMEPPVEQSLNRTRFTPSEDSTDESLLGKRNQVDPVVGSVPEVDSKDDDDGESDTEIESGSKSGSNFLRDRKATPEEVEMYRKRVGLSGGFDVFSPVGVDFGIIASILPLSRKKINTMLKDFKLLLEKAFEVYKDNVGGQKLQVRKIVKANQRRYNGTFLEYYITFTAKGSLDGQLRCYLALVRSSILKDGENVDCSCHLRKLESTAETVSLVDTSEDVEQKEFYWVDTLKYVLPKDTFDQLGRAWHPDPPLWARSPRPLTSTSS